MITKTKQIHSTFPPVNRLGRNERSGPASEDKKISVPSPLAGLDELCVLVVEDSESDFFAVKRLLSHHMPWNVRVLRAKTLAEAEHILSSGQDRPHIVLLDLGLPDSDQPIETYNRVSIYKDQVPVVVLTGFDDHQLALDMIGVGAQDYICKNLIVMQPDLLLRTIEFAMGRHQLVSSSLHEVEKKLKQTSELLNLMSGSYSAGH
ncbi:MAG: response regulator [Pseudobdellovibrionaceae bacterium]|jgi:DNA-binding NarL/FixJ family response regulator|nr:response regulator [Pseudobdellovibrionaceae bacterium]